MLLIEGRPTTMIPLQKLEKSCRAINWVMTIIARLLERTVVTLAAGDASSARSAGLSELEAGTGRRMSVVLDLGSSVCSSSNVVVAISNINRSVRNWEECMDVTRRGKIEAGRVMK